MLDARQATIRSERSARREPLSDREVRELLRGVRTVIVTRGKKSIVLEAAQVSPADLKGPTGSYRAPLVLRGDTLLVGFNREALEELL